MPESEAGQWNSFPEEVHSSFLVWKRPQKTLRFNNVGTAASITGAARSVLMKALAVCDAYYCDTDSVIAPNLKGVDIDEATLGSWKVEASITRLAVAGKKLYGYQKDNGKEIVRAKGGNGLMLVDIEAMARGDTVTSVARGVTIRRDGSQYYMERRLRAVP